MGERVPQASSPSSNFDPRASTFAALDRYFCPAILVPAAVVIPRSLSIARAHSESYDDQFYLVGGLALLTREPMERMYNDPPLGQGIEAVPLWLSGCTLRAAAEHAGLGWIDCFNFPVFYGQPLPPETLLLLVAAWK